MTDYSQESMFAIGELLCEIGLSLLWIKPCSKQPIQKSWTTLPKQHWQQLKENYHTDYNLGCRTGCASTFTDQSCLLVFDVDIKGGKSFEKLALEKLTELLNTHLDNYPYVISPRGRHYYTRCPIKSLLASQLAFKSQELCELMINGCLVQRPAYQIEIMSSGRQILLPPSIHPDTNTSYQWGKAFANYEDIPLLSQAQLSRFNHPIHDANQLSKTRLHTTPKGTFKAKQLELTRYPLAKDIIELIQQGVAKGQRSEKLYKASIAMVNAGMNAIEICSVLTDSQYQLSEKPLEERRHNRQSAMEWVYKYSYLPALATHLPPEPLGITITKPDIPPIERLGELGEIVEVMAKITQVPIAMALQSFLASCSLLTQSIANVAINHTPKPCSLYFITIAESGDRKTTIDHIALQPIQAMEKQKIQQYLEANKRYAMLKTVYDSEIKQHLKECVKNKNYDLTMESEAPEPPRNPQMLIEEPTYEGLVQHLAVGQPAIGLISNEAGRMVSSHAMNKDNRLKTIAGLSSIWDGQAISRTRKTDGTLKLYHRRLTMHLMMQPQIANTLLGDGLLKEQGLLARCLISYPLSLAGTRMYQETTDVYQDVMAVYQQLIQPLLDHKPLLDEQGGLANLPTLTLDEESKPLWIAFYNEVEQQQGKQGRYQVIKGFASKASEQAIRLAGVLTLVADSTAQQISSDAMQGAIQLMGYYLNEQVRLANIWSINPNLILAERVLDYILQHHDQGCISLVEIYTNLHSIKGKTHAETLIKILEHHHHVIKYPTSKIIHGHKRQKVWRLHPHYFNVIDDQE